MMRVLKAFFLLPILFLSMIYITQAQDIPVQSERASIARSISVYPNPATDYIEVNLDQLNAGSVTLALYNIIGNPVAAESEVIDQHKIRIRVKDLSGGYYLIALRDEETKFKGTYKFLKR
jgi:hypothetical protein